MKFVFLVLFSLVFFNGSVMAQSANISTIGNGKVSDVESLAKPSPVETEAAADYGHFLKQQPKSGFKYELKSFIRNKLVFEKDFSLFGHSFFLEAQLRRRPELYVYTQVKKCDISVEAKPKAIRFRITKAF